MRKTLANNFCISCRLKSNDEMAKSIELSESFERAIKQAFKHSFTNFFIKFSLCFSSVFFGGFFLLAHGREIMYKFIKKDQLQKESL